ncbi:MAG TPA: GNAT family N-acetyltransferase, partial [Candidatus Limnocylindrales bacterium]|nr:GNAT family N-acetyltransferase [Candidatus Limnocylindrales bacterium]
MSAATIREMTADDVAPAADVVRRGEFGEREDFFRWSVGRPTIRPFVAVVDGEIVGTATASVHGPVGWVGVIFVAPAWRGAGVGRRLTRTVVDELEAAGCRSIVLIASSMGRPIYEREGFAIIDRQVRFTADGIAPGNVTDTEPAAAIDDGVRPFTEADRSAVHELDRWGTGEDRTAVLADLVDPASTLVAVRRDGLVEGYLARSPWRGGALIARDPETALRLLERRRRATGSSG